MPERRYDELEIDPIHEAEIRTKIFTHIGVAQTPIPAPVVVPIFHAMTAIAHASGLSIAPLYQGRIVGAGAHGLHSKHIAITGSKHGIYTADGVAIAVCTAVGYQCANGRVLEDIEAVTSDSDFRLNITQGCDIGPQAAGHQETGAGIIGRKQGIGMAITLTCQLYAVVRVGDVSGIHQPLKSIEIIGSIEEESSPLWEEKAEGVVNV